MLAPTHIDLKKDRGLTIAWNDGTSSYYSISYLRRMSPSADVAQLRDEMEHNPLAVLPSASLRAGPVVATAASLVGNYALKIEFSDGHATGIYSWKYLREIDPARRTNDATPTPPRRLAVFISGGGRTLMNLLERTRRGDLPAEVALVVASGDCPGVGRAREAGLSVIVPPAPLDADALERLLAEHAIDLVVLAGYLKLLPIPPTYRGRVLNIHPALLPKFGGPGMFGSRVHQAVLAAGEQQSGCTVHFCDDRYDTGPIVLQRTCPVLPGDTPETLAQRVFEQELEAYPQAIQNVLGTLPPR